MGRNSILLQLMEDPNGCHVILALVNYFPYDMVEFIFELSLAEYKELAKNRHGLCVLKKCVTLCPAEMFMEFSARVCNDAMSLVNHQYGNYLLQHILDRANNVTGEGQEYIKDFVQCNMWLHSGLKTYYGWLSRQKFSSNVVEKCLGLDDGRLNTLITEEILEDKDKNIPALLRCGYGNYVLQALLSGCSNLDIKPQLIQTITQYVGLLRPNIKKKWERLLQCHVDESSEADESKLSNSKIKIKNVLTSTTEIDQQMSHTTKSTLVSTDPSSTVKSFHRSRSTTYTSNHRNSSRGRNQKK